MNRDLIRTPPLLLGATLLFWGWQAGLLWVGAIMGVVLEGGRLLKVRWEFSNEDFQRIWTFCTLLLLVSLVYAFTSNEGPADFRGFFQNPNYLTQRNAGTASAKTAASVIRWLPMLFFLFVAAQTYSSREAIPLETISLILRRRWRKARKLGKPAPPSQSVNVTYPYFALCLLASAVHTGEDIYYFWGLCVLLPWALWPLRPRRYSVALWGAMALTAIAFGYVGQRGVGELSRYLEGINSQLLARWTRGRFDASQSRMDFGDIGRLKASTRIVMRVETPPGNPPPPLLREASYRALRRGSVWMGESMRSSSFEAVQSETNQTSWVLVPGKSNIATVNIACYLEGRSGGFDTGLLPLPVNSGRLENLPAYLLSRNNLGAVLAQGPGLLIFDALYGPGPTIDSAPSPMDTDVPEYEKAALAEVLSGLSLADKPLPEVRRALEEFFNNNFTYSLFQDRPPRGSRTNETHLARFLLKTRSGHCEYFATATVLLLRQLNIPARYAVGHAVHEANGPRKYVVRERDAHAWCLVWNQERGVWENLDTTPGSWIEAEGQRPTRLLWLSDFWSRVKFEISKIRWGQTRLRLYLLWISIPVLILLLYQIIFRRRRRKGKGRTAELKQAWPGLDSEFYEVAARVERQGVPRRAGEPLAQWLTRAMADPRCEPWREALRELLRLHYQYRFDPLGITPADRDRLREESRSFSRKMSRGF